MSQTIQNTSPRQSLIKEVQLYLGYGMIGLDLRPEHYDFSITAAFSRYRQRSTNSFEESFLFLDIQGVFVPTEIRSLLRLVLSKELV